ncbi:MAG: hypothetical protein M3P18_09130 [Actinomycetota bacterium]|nr:hypothetical protein [Actinomycetota bacterium]
MAMSLEQSDVEVLQTNGTGFRTRERGWVNVSRYANPTDVLLPSVGERVVLHLDKAGFVRRIEPVAPIATQNAPQTRTGPMAGQTAPEAIVSTSGPIAQDDRGIVITRLAVLNTAVALLSSGGGATTLEEVLDVAARLEAWATR